MWSKLRILASRKVLIVLILVVVSGIGYMVFQASSLTFSVHGEIAAMEQLEEQKLRGERSVFVSDGCSGNISQIWQRSVTSLSSLSTQFADAYQSASTLPFEAACIEHDRLYHAGEGGYAGRLVADMQLRRDIIEYAIAHSDEIKARTGIEERARVLQLYEIVADTMYQGVRIGGVPCTGKPYAWGYGYGGGSCTE